MRITKIIRFSKLESFIDNPIRPYSSGMYALWAFSVAIHVVAYILLVDEILGVGDMNFQAKCANKIYEMRKKGVTILMVSHDMSSIDRLCDYAIWLDHGKKIAEGEPKEIQRKYLEYMAEQNEERKEEEIRKEELDNNVDIKDETKNENDIEVKEHISKIEINSLGEHYGNGDIIFMSFKLLNDRKIDKRSFQTVAAMMLEVEYMFHTDLSSLQPTIVFEITTS